MKRSALGEQLDGKRGPELARDIMYSNVTDRIGDHVHISVVALKF